MSMRRGGRGARRLGLLTGLVGAAVTVLPPAAASAATPPVCVIATPQIQVDNQGTTQSVQVDGSRSYDPDGGALTYLWNSDGTGTTLSHLDSSIVTDTFRVQGAVATWTDHLTVFNTSYSASCDATITVVDTLAPRLVAPADAVFEAGPATTAQVNAWLASAVATDPAAAPGDTPPVSNDFVANSGIGGVGVGNTVRVTWTAANPYVNTVTAQAQASVSVVDTTAPALDCTAPDRSLWYPDNVTVPCTASDFVTPLPAFTLATSVPGGTETSSAASSSQQVCDAAGNCSTAGPYTYQVDRKPPSITCEPATFQHHQAGAVVSAQATDGGSGPASQTVTAAADTSTTGAKTVAMTATDNVGNVTTVDCPYTVTGYVFSGFLAPVNNPNTVNTGKAGKTYPLKWRLTDDSGNTVTDLAAVASTTYRASPCAAFSSDPNDALEVSATGSTSLRYDTSANEYVYNWATPAPGCYTLFVTLADGSSYPAYFNLS